MRYSSPLMKNKKQKYRKFKHDFKKTFTSKGGLVSNTILSIFFFLFAYESSLSQDREFGTCLVDWSQSDKLSEIKPPLAVIKDKY